MKKSLFVAGLDFSVNDEALKELFSQHGTVETAKVVTDRYSGQSRGFVFVDMATQDNAQNCINNLNNTTHHNRQLVVKFKEASASRSGGYNDSRW